MDESMSRVAKEDRRTEDVGKRFINWKEEIRESTKDRNEYVMIVAENNPVQFNEFMSSPVELFLTAISTYTKRYQKQKEGTGKKG